MRRITVVVSLALALATGCAAFAEESAGTAACQSNADCVPATCCHPNACVPKAKAPKCDKVACTMNCKPRTLDCGGGRCECAAGACTVKLGPQ